ncbi:MAG: glycosyltransferase, partial [Mycobacterium sp.]|nr:glycosyltransferase [Mycobacterium sp.]
MSVVPVTLLVVAKAPVPGRAKTRLAATVGDQLAAEIAAAALLDTLDAVAATPVATRVVALTGELADAADAD